jgi:hypothetical protein
VGDAVVRVVLRFVEMPNVSQAWANACTSSSGGRRGAPTSATRYFQIPTDRAVVEAMQVTI